MTRINGRAAIDFGEFGSQTRRHDIRAGVDIDYWSLTSAVVADAGGGRTDQRTAGTRLGPSATLG